MDERRPCPQCPTTVRVRADGTFTTHLTRPGGLVCPASSTPSLRAHEDDRNPIP